VGKHEIVNNGRQKHLNADDKILQPSGNMVNAVIFPNCALEQANLVDKSKNNSLPV
jgi:hypothetical protein